MKKRIASVLVALVMVLSLVPKTSWAWTSTVTTLEQLKSAMSELSYNNTIEIVVSGTIEISETLNIRPTRTTNGSMAWYEYYNQRVVISGADANSKLVRAGNASAMLFSLLGGLTAMLVMILLRRLRCLSIYGVSIGGAAGHNLGQMAAALITLGNTAVLGYLPFLLGISLLTGTLTGFVSSLLFRAMAHIKLSTKE